MQRYARMQKMQDYATGLTLHMVQGIRKAAARLRFAAGKYH